VGAINELSTNRIEIADFETNGPAGTVVEIPSNLEVMAVTAHQMVVTSLKKNIGEIAIGYSQDGKVKDTNKFKVFNSGDIGISMRAVVHCRG
jgi:formyltetrahydrofolate synthetase